MAEPFIPVKISEDERSRRIEEFVQARLIAAEADRRETDLMRQLEEATAESARLRAHARILGDRLLLEL